MRKYAAINQNFQQSTQKRVASRMNSNIHPMNYKNLEIRTEGNAKERSFGLTHPIEKRKNQYAVKYF